MDDDTLYVQQLRAEVDCHIHLEEKFLSHMGQQSIEDLKLHLQRLQQSTAFLTMRQESVERRWSSLYDWDKHHELKSAIMEQLWTERSTTED